jgi:hypothetical protein
VKKDNTHTLRSGDIIYFEEWLHRVITASPMTTERVRLCRVKRTRNYNSFTDCGEPFWRDLADVEPFATFVAHVYS